MNSFLTQRELLSILFKEKKMLMIVFIIPFVLIVGVSFLLTPVYEADAKLLIKSGREFQVRSDPGQQPATVPYQTKQEVVNSELEILASHDLIQAVVNQIGPEKLYPQLADKTPSDMSPLDFAVKIFSKDLKVDNAMMSEVITVSYLNKDRDMAVMALDTLLKMYQAKHATMFGDNRSDFFKTKLGDYTARLDAVTVKIADLRKSQSLFDVIAQRGQLIQDRSTVAGTLRALQARAVDAKAQSGYFTEKLKHMNPLMVAGEDEAEAVDNAKSKLIDLKSQLNSLRQRFSSDIKPIQDIQEQIASVEDFINGKGTANKKLYKTRDPAYDEGVMKLQSANAELATVSGQITLQQKNLDDLDARLVSLEDGARQLEILEREHATLDDLTRNTRTSFEQAGTNEQMDQQRLVSINIFEHASALPNPVKPKRLLFLAAGMVMGLGCAGAMVLYLLAFRKTLITAESVERILHVKVLAAIPSKI